MSLPLNVYDKQTSRTDKMIEAGIVPVGCVRGSIIRGNTALAEGGGILEYSCGTSLENVLSNQ